MGKDIKPSMDIIIVSNARSDFFKRVTEKAIVSCIISSDMIKFNFIIIEQNSKVNYRHENAKTIHYNFSFNYNKCLNLGLSHSKSKYVALCNNDLSFRRYWAENVIYAMKDEYLSASPAQVSQNLPPVEGYEIAKELLGWCFVINRKLMDIIGPLDEGVLFWYSDDIYADQLRQKGIKHILVRRAAVRHLHSLTLKRARNRNQLMKRQHSNYKKAREKYL